MKARLWAWSLWLIAVWVGGAPVLVHSQNCLPVAGEFALTGLSNLDGNYRNHELGVCLLHFRLNVTSACKLTITPMYTKGATISLLQVGEVNGQPNIPRASDPPANVLTAVELQMGYYYLSPIDCPLSYSSTIKGEKLMATDVADAIRRGIGVDAGVMPGAAFTDTGITFSWLLQGTTPNQLAYTAIAKTGGPTMPDFQPFGGSTNNACSLLDINPQADFDMNPQDGIVDSSAATLVGRLPRAIPNRPGYYICAIAPAGGSVKVTRSAGAMSSAPVRYAYTADQPTAYGACPAGTYLYKLGAITMPNDPQTDSCQVCPRGSFGTQGSTLCGACAAGQYSSKQGSRSCTQCRYGSASYEGAQRCMACFYGRAYCSEGWSPNEALFTCNSARLPSGYAPEQGYSTVRPLTDPTAPDVAASYSSLFRACNVDTQQSVLAFNVSGECQVDIYVLGDLGKGQGPMACSANAALNSVSAYYTAPNILAGLDTKGLNKMNVGIQGVMYPDGLRTMIFAASFKAAIPNDKMVPTAVTFALTPIGYSYLGGGDNGQGRNAMVRGVAQDPCPPGTTKQLLNADGTASPGEDPGNLLNSYCVPCPVGTYCDTTTETPANCPAGTYGPIIGAKDEGGCVNCPLGTYQDIDGSHECLVCPENTFAGSPGATQCTACGDGYGVSEAGAEVCNPCAAGTFRDSTISEKCQPCKAGTSSGPAAAQCTICLPGTYAPTAKSSSCTDCPRGTFQSKYGMKKCEDCPEGSYQDARGQRRCKVCQSGTFNKNRGSFSASACQVCPAGQASPMPGSGSCTNCNPGYFTQKPGSASCTACNAGTYAPNPGSKACTPCPRGTFSDKKAATNCTACEIGFFSSSTGASRCNSCPQGYFTESKGAGVCKRCSAGTYSTRIGASSAITCVACPAGSFSYQGGSTSCQLCPAGTYTAAAGAANCEDCPLGTYSTEAGSMRCLPCKAGLTTSSTGSTRDGDCNVRTSLNSRKSAL